MRALYNSRRFLAALLCSLMLWECTPHAPCGQTMLRVLETELAPSPPPLPAAESSHKGRRKGQMQTALAPDDGERKRRRQSDTPYTWGRKGAGGQIRASGRDGEWAGARSGQERRRARFLVGLPSSTLRTTEPSKCNEVAPEAHETPSAARHRHRTPYTDACAVCCVQL